MTPRRRSVRVQTEPKREGMLFWDALPRWNCTRSRLLVASDVRQGSLKNRPITLTLYRCDILLPQQMIQRYGFWKEQR